MEDVVKGELGDLMDDNDWAIIFDKEGNVRGLFIPDGMPNGAVVPENILKILEEAGLSEDDFADPVMH